MNNEFEVIIVGDGIAGSSLALQLLKLGIKDICILEKQKFPRIKACTGIITKPSYNLLKEIDIDVKDLDFVTKKDEDLQEIQFFDKTKYVCKIPNILDAYFPIAATRKDFDKYLYEFIKSKNINFKTEVNIKDIDFDNNVVNTNEENYKYKYLVFADGASGFSSKYSKIKNKSICLEGVFKKTGDKAFFNGYTGITKNGYTWLLETKEYCSIGFCDIYRKNINYKDLLVKFAKEIGYELDKKDIRGAFLPMDLSKNIIINKNVIMIGDAAGLNNPATMEGIYHALYSSKMAALSIKNNNIKGYKKSIKNLMIEQKYSRFVLTFFYKPFFQKIFFSLLSGRNKDLMVYLGDSLLVQRKYLLNPMGFIKALRDYRKEKNEKRL